MQEPAVSAMAPCGRQISLQDIQLVQNLIERCLQLYMPQKEVIQTLQAQAKIEPGFTNLVWQKLEEQNPAFFQAYYLRLKVKDQVVLFNHLLDQQIQIMQRLHSSWLQALPQMLASRPGIPGIPPAILPPGVQAAAAPTAMPLINMAESTHMGLSPVPDLPMGAPANTGPPSPNQALREAAPQPQEQQPHPPQPSQQQDPAPASLPSSGQPAAAGDLGQQLPVTLVPGSLPLLPCPPVAASTPPSAAYSAARGAAAGQLSLALQMPSLTGMLPGPPWAFFPPLGLGLPKGPLPFMMQVSVGCLPHQQQPQQQSQVPSQQVQQQQQEQQGDQQQQPGLGSKAGVGLATGSQPMVGPHTLLPDSGTAAGTSPPGPPAAAAEGAATLPGGSSAAAGEGVGPNAAAATGEDMLLWDQQRVTAAAGGAGGQVQDSGSGSSYHQPPFSSTGLPQASSPAAAAAAVPAASTVSKLCPLVPLSILVHSASQDQLLAEFGLEEGTQGSSLNIPTPTQDLTTAAASATTAPAAGGGGGWTPVVLQGGPLPSMCAMPTEVQGLGLQGQALNPCGTLPQNGRDQLSGMPEGLGFSAFGGPELPMSLGCEDMGELGFGALGAMMGDLPPNFSFGDMTPLDLAALGQGDL